MSRTATVAVVAEPFGFGPASKALAVSKQLINQGLQVVPVLSSIAADFFVANEWKGFIERRAPALWLGESTTHLDGAIICLDLAAASHFVERMPTFFVDSLGFMWNRDFLCDPTVPRLETYFVQDVFESSARVSSIAHRTKIHSVGAIVDLTGSEDPSGPQVPGNIAALGGLYVESPTFDASGYWALVDRILDPEKWQICVSDRGRRAVCARGIMMHHAAFMYTLARARHVAMSPGLTTILEAAALGVTVMPLPPQNYSQALIVRKLAELGAGLPWSLLSDIYAVAEGLQEVDGIRVIQERNVAVSHDSSFVGAMRDYLNLDSSYRVLPQALCSSFAGAAEIAVEVTRALSTNL